MAFNSGKKVERLQSICFDLEKRQKFGMAGFVRGLQFFRQEAIHEPRSLSSYSLQRVVPTWASLAKLEESEKLALGNWIGKQATVAQTPAPDRDSPEAAVAEQRRHGGQ